MKIIDNTSHLLGDDLKSTIERGSRLKIAASCFSIYAFEALKSELSKIESLQFIFTAPTFVPDEVTDRLRKERREFFIPKTSRETGLYGTEFEIQLRNKLTQRAIARECAEWIRRKARFRSNTTKAPMQQLMHVANGAAEIAYMPISGFTAVDLGYQKGDAVSNFVTRFDDPTHAQIYLELFDQIWSDSGKVRDVTDAICDHIESVYQENSPERIYFQILYNIFNEFLQDIDEDVLPNDLTGYPGADRDQRRRGGHLRARGQGGRLPGPGAGRLWRVGGPDPGRLSGGERRPGVAPVARSVPRDGVRLADLGLGQAAGEDWAWGGL